MSTTDNEILIRHRKKEELIDKIDKVIGQAMDDHLDLDDIIYALQHKLDRLKDFRLDQVMAYRYGLKEGRNEKGNE